MTFHDSASGNEQDSSPRVEAMGKVAVDAADFARRRVAAVLAPLRCQICTNFRWCRMCLGR